MKKFLILLMTLGFLSSCIKVVVEPHWGGNHQEQKGTLEQGSTSSDLTKH